MEFNIRKNSTLPVLKLSVVKDGRSDYHRFMSMIEESAIFFSMINVETGIPKITSRPAGFVEKVQISPEADPEYYIYYQFTAKNTNKVGRYEGQFLLRNSEGTLILPIREQLFINIQESFIADDLPYETCYVSEFDCCVKPYPTSVAISPTPTPTPTSTPIPTSTPTPTPTNTPTSTPTPTPTPTPSSEPFIVGIDIMVSTGSVIFDFVVTLPRTIDVDYELSLTKSFNVVTGSSIVVDAIVNVPTGSLTGSTRVVIDEDWNNIAEGSQTMVVNHNTNGVIPLISQTENIVYEFVPKVTNTATPTPTPTSTPTPTPTSTPTPTPTNTPTSTPTPTPTNTPTPTQSLPVVENKVYYGKLTRQQINITDINNFSILETNSILSKYLFFEMVAGYCYIVIPSTMIQPDLFKNSVEGCNGFTIPFVRVDDLTIIDSSGNSVIYYVYRSFVLTNSSVDVWVCN
jgi:hypothetical protein